MDDQPPMNKPIVLAISGADPSGGAGISADIETISALGCRCAPVISSLTVQDTVSVRKVVPVTPELVIEQVRAVLDDMTVAVIKFGLLPDPQLIMALGCVLREYEKINVVLDPVLRAGSGDRLSAEDCIRALAEQLLPLTTVLTPNAAEARQLAPQSRTLEACASWMMDTGCHAVFIKGADEPGTDVRNSLYQPDQAPVHYHWPRLPGTYHGSGCTLASAIASYLAMGMTLELAVQNAQQYTWDALKAGEQLGRGQRHPDRLFALPRGET